VHERLAIVGVGAWILKKRGCSSSTNMRSDTGAQPLVSEDGKIVLAVNGEIYNHIQLRNSVGPGVKFKTHSDCEVIIPLVPFVPALALRQRLLTRSYIVPEARQGRMHAPRRHVLLRPARRVRQPLACDRRARPNRYHDALPGLVRGGARHDLVRVRAQGAPGRVRHDPRVPAGPRVRLGGRPHRALLPARMVGRRRARRANADGARGPRAPARDARGGGAQAAHVRGAVRRAPQRRARQQPDRRDRRARDGEGRAEALRGPPEEGGRAPERPAHAAHRPHRRVRSVPDSAGPTGRR
jgi:hypothetical protein